MPFRSRLRGAPRGGPKRGMEWISAGSATFSTVAPTVLTAVWIVLPTQARTFTNPTLVRTRGQMIVAPIAIAGVDSDMFGAVGVIAWSSRADAIIAGSPPNPYLDPDLDWVWHSYFFGAGGTAAPENDHNWMESKSGTAIDSRAMRKLGADDGVMACCYNAAGVGGVSWALGVRCLIKE